MNGYLGRRDPTVKLLVAVAVSLVLVLVIDPLTPLLFGAGALVAGLVLGGVRLATFLQALGPLAIVGLGFVWTNALFAHVGPDAPLALSWGPLRVSAAGLSFGLAIALRGLAIGLLSVLFVLTTDPTGLVVSLIRHARLPYRVGYPLLAAYRFLPFFTEEYAQVALAQRVRGVPVGRSPLARVRRALSLLLPLLASAVRRAARIAIAMDARGFASAGERTYLRETRLVAGDLVFAVGALGLALALLVAGALGGWLRFWDGRFAA